MAPPKKLTPERLVALKPEAPNTFLYFSFLSEYTRIAVNLPNARKMRVQACIYRQNLNNESRERREKTLFPQRVGVMKMEFALVREL